MTYSDAYDPREGIAIIGMAGFFPESPNVEALWRNLLSRSDVTDLVGPMTIMVGNANDYIATRASYKFDLKCPRLQALSGG